MHPSRSLAPEEPRSPTSDRFAFPARRWRCSGEGPRRAPWPARSRRISAWSTRGASRVLATRGRAPGDPGGRGIPGPLARPAAASRNTCRRNRTNRTRGRTSRVWPRPPGRDGGPEPAAAHPRTPPDRTGRSPRRCETGWLERVRRPQPCLSVLQVVAFHLGLVAVRLRAQEIDLGGLGLSPLHAVSEGLQFRPRRPQLAEELDRGHRPFPLFLQALQILQRDLEGVRDLPGPLLLRIRDVEDEPADHRLARRVVPHDGREDGQGVLDGGG